MKIDFTKYELEVLSAITSDAAKKAMETVLKNPSVVIESDFYFSLASISFKLIKAVSDMKEGNDE